MTADVGSCRMCGTGPCVGGGYGPTCAWWIVDTAKKTYQPDPRPTPKKKPRR